ncbi:MAG: carboxypeptidase-like regulatory domain-containing protein [Thaumarchaeota archaeon]|nr:carboxypeptidase-like regulatory domain-containing protein [Nitrososphaerota archaeon]
MSNRKLLLFGVVLLLAVVSFPLRPVSAATVTVTITVTVAEAGAPGLPFTWTVIGCGGGSGPTGSAVPLTLTASCAYTINTPADGLTQRDRLTSGSTYVMSLPEAGCATSCSVSDTAHVQELLTVSANCNGAAVSPTSPTSDRWFNYGASVTVTCNGIWGRASGTGTRAVSWNWDGGANTNVATTATFTTSSQTMNGGHTMNVNVGTQYQLTIDPKATAALASVTIPTITSDNYWYDTGTSVTYTGNSVFHRVSGVGNRSTSWYLDAGVPTTLSTTGTFTIPVTMTSAHAVHVTLKAQYRITLDTGATSGLNAITSPTIASDNYWYDTGTAVTLTLNGAYSRTAGTGDRLQSYTINGGTAVAVSTAGTATVFNAQAIISAQSVAGTTTTQYLLTLDSGAASALATITPTPIPGDSHWYDAGTQVTYSGNGVFGRASGTGSRVAIWWVDSSATVSVLTSGTFPAVITMSAPHLLHTATVTQLEVILTGTYGVSSATQPTIAGDNYWYDSGTAVSFSLDGVFGRASGSGERTVSYSVNSGPPISEATAGSVVVLNSFSLTSPETITVSAVKQYELTLDALTTQALRSVTPPTLTGDNYWYDSGSRIIVTANGVWGRNLTTGYRLASFSVNGAAQQPVASSGSITLLDLASISSSQSIASNKAVQYLLVVVGGGGSTYSANPPIAGDTGWYDSGTTLKVMTNGTYGTDGGTRQRVASWTIDNGPITSSGGANLVTTSEIIMDAQHTVHFFSATQYLVTIVVKDSSGANVLQPSVMQVDVNGETHNVIGNQVWADNGSKLSIVGITWHGEDVTMPQATPFVVSQAGTVDVNTRVYDATIIVKDLLGFPVGGAGVTVTLANGTVLHTVTGGDGTVNLRMIPLGTYRATVTNLGTSSSISGDASVQSTAEVHISLSYSTIGGIILVIVLVVIAIVLIRRRPSKESVY